MDSGDGSGSNLWGECAKSPQDVSPVCGWLRAPAATQESLDQHTESATGVGRALQHPNILHRQGKLTAWFLALIKNTFSSKYKMKQRLENGSFNWVQVLFV